MNFSFTWDTFWAFAFIASALLVAAGVVVAYGHLSDLRDELAHLRRVSQLDGTMALFAELGSLDHRTGVQWIMMDLSERMRDSAYRADAGKPWSSNDHPELRVLQRYERFGIYVRRGLVDADVVLDYVAPTIVAVWDVLAKTRVLEVQRTQYGMRWANAEYLVERARSHAASV